MGCYQAIEHMIKTRYSMVIKIAPAFLVLMVIALKISIIWMLKILKAEGRKPEFIIYSLRPLICVSK
jgi:hypothetical protein